MEVEIIDEDENPMLHRTDVRFQLTHEEATPSRLSVRDSLAAKLNKDAGEVVLRTLDTKYGMRKTVGYAKVYEDAEHATAVEQDYALERNKIATGGEVETKEGDEADDEVEADDEAEAEADDEAEAEADEDAGANDRAEAEEA